MVGEDVGSGVRRKCCGQTVPVVAPAELADLDGDVRIVGREGVCALLVERLLIAVPEPVVDGDGIARPAVAGIAVAGFAAGVAAGCVVAVATARGSDEAEDQQKRQQAAPLLVHLFPLRWSRFPTARTAAVDSSSVMVVTHKRSKHAMG